MIARVVSSSPQVTRGVGEALGRVASGPLALLLVGDYGTGKTTFVQGLAVGLEVADVVRSPSFNILKRYDSGRLPLVHADLYRTQSDPDIEELGILDILQSAGILAVEWPGRYLPPAREMPNISIQFSFATGNIAAPTEDSQLRVLDFSWREDCPARIAEVLSALAA
jgi:tRNA threonylcarbamoyladenosine biosynthesis protein TsaE